MFVGNEKVYLFWAVVNPLVLPSEESEGTTHVKFNPKNSLVGTTL